MREGGEHVHCTIIPSSAGGVYTCRISQIGGKDTAIRDYNECMAHGKQLHHLQKIDSETARIAKRIRDIEHTLESDQNVRKARMRAVKAKQRMQQAEKELRQAEAEVAAQSARLEQNQAALYGGRIQNPKELQDLQQEAAALRRRIARLEEAQLEAMQRLEESRLRYKKSVRLYRKTQAEQRQNHAALLGEKVTLQAKQEKLQHEREALVAKLPADEYQLYEDLRSKRGGIAVAEVQNGACGACGTTLSTRMLQVARSPSRIAHCPGCNRILYEAP